MPDPNQGKDLALSDPFMQIGLTIAKVGKMVQDGEVPQSVKDAYEALKAHAASGGQSLQQAYETVKKHVTDAVSQPVKGEELLSDKQGPNQPETTTKSSQPGLVSQKDFADSIRKRLPKLQNLTDPQIVNKMIEINPDLANQVENYQEGDSRASVAQNRLENEAKSPSYISPDFWNKHPNMKQFLLGATGTLPGVGAMGGATLAGPETMGLGSIPAAMGGAGVGQGARDYINMLAGLDQTSPTQKGLNIGMESGLAGITPGITEAILHPMDTLRGSAGVAAKIQNNLTPRLIRNLRMLAGDSGDTMLEKFAKGGTKTVDSMMRPAWQSATEPEKSTIDRLEELISGQKSGPGISDSVPTELPKTQIGSTLGKTGNKELPKFRINNDGTFTNMSTGEVLDKSGKPVLPIHEQAKDISQEAFYKRWDELAGKVGDRKATPDELSEYRMMNQLMDKQISDNSIFKNKSFLDSLVKRPFDQPKKEGLSNITRHLGPFLK